MIQWPNLGIFGDFEPCEEGLLEALNSNFLLLNVMTQGRFIDFATSLPVSPTEGDVYILTTDQSINFYDGHDWVKIISQNGFIAYNETTDWFYFFDGSNWIPMPTGTGDVTGYTASDDNEIVRYNGTSGKSIQGSGIYISDAKVLYGAEGIESAGHIYGRLIEGAFGVDNTSAGADQNIATPNTFAVKFTAALTSIASIAVPTLPNATRLHILINGTGGNLTLKNTATVRTGTSSDLIIANGAAVMMAFDSNSNQWFVVGGSGGGGGSSLVKVGSNASPRSIDPAVGFQESNGDLVASADEQIVYFVGDTAGEFEVSATNLLDATLKEHGVVTLVGMSNDAVLVLKEGSSNVTIYGDKRLGRGEWIKLMKLDGLGVTELARG